MTATGPTAPRHYSYTCLSADRPLRASLPPCGQSARPTGQDIASAATRLKPRSSLGQQTARLAAARSLRPAAVAFDDRATAAGAGAVRIRRRGRSGLLSALRHAVA